MKLNPKVLLWLFGGLIAAQLLRLAGWGDLLIGLTLIAGGVAVAGDVNNDAE